MSLLVDRSLRPLSTVLTWYKMKRAEYHFNKFSASALIGTGVFAEFHHRLGFTAAMWAGGLTYLIVGKVLYLLTTPKEEQTPFAKEVLDCISDFVIGVASCLMLACWYAFPGNLTVFLSSIVTFTILYGIPYFFALP